MSCIQSSFVSVIPDDVYMKVARLTVLYLFIFLVPVVLGIVAIGLCHRCWLGIRVCSLI